MKPCRAADTSATASGKRTRMASRSATACSSGPPVALTCCSAAAVSSTAVLSVSVADQRAVTYRRAVGGQDEPARLLAVAVRADVEPDAHRRLGRDDPGELLAVPAVRDGDLGDPSELLVQRHLMSLDSAPWSRPSP